MGVGTVVVIGASGFIGRALCRELAGRGYEVVGVSRQPDRARDALDCAAEVLGWHGPPGRGWSEAAEGARAVVNLAGETIGRGRWTRAKRARILGSRVDAGRALTETVLRAHSKPAVVLQASAVGIYGDRGDEILDEGAGRGSGFLAEVSGRWEESTRPVEAAGVRRVIVRSAVVLGRGGGALPGFERLFRFGAAPLPGDGRSWLPWIHLADEVRAIAMLIERDDLSGAFNLAAPQPVSTRDFFRALAAARGGRILGRIPAWALRAALGLKAREVLLASQRTAPRRLLEAGFDFRFPDLAAALRDLSGVGREAPQDAARR